MACTINMLQLSIMVVSDDCTINTINGTSRSVNEAPRSIIDAPNCGRLCRNDDPYMFIVQPTSVLTVKR